MSAPHKIGLSYFAFSVDMLRDRKFRYVRDKYGCVAIMVYIALLCILYGDKGYYVDYSDNQKLNVIWEIKDMLAGRYQPSSETIQEIIEALVACGLFDGDQFKAKTITSVRSQETYYRSVLKRKGVVVDRARWIVPIERLKEISSTSNPILNFFNGGKNKVNDGNKKINDGNKKQIKLNKREDILYISSCTLPLKDGSEHKISQKEFDEYVKLFPDVDVMAHIRNMRAWLLGNEARRKTKQGIKRFISGWLIKAQAKAQEQQQSESVYPLNKIN